MSVAQRMGKLLPRPIRPPLARLASLVLPRRMLKSDPRRKIAEAARARFSRIDWHGRAGRRIIYALTPPARLANIGDHAQVVAIRAWLAKHYPGFPVVELDKDVVAFCREAIRQRVRGDDLVFLHSGGNLGDRGIWSETGRRALIADLTKNKIVSLPQTIFFSDTETGRSEREISRQIYARHPNLTILGRDQVSGQIAREIFNGARVGTFPDFVLSLEAEDLGVAPNRPLHNKILACLRCDDESAFGELGRTALADALGSSATMFDTTFDRPILPERRREELRATLELFASHEAVVTDRYHGLIFAVICRKPAVVLGTVDHKLTSAIEWFSEIPNVRLCEDLSRVSKELELACAVPSFGYPDFNEIYFDGLPAFLDSEPLAIALEDSKQEVS